MEIREHLCHLRYKIYTFNRAHNLNELFIMYKGLGVCGGGGGVCAGCLFSLCRLSDSEDPTAGMSSEIYLCLGSKADKSRSVIMLSVTQL